MRERIYERVRTRNRSGFIVLVMCLLIAAECTASLDPAPVDRLTGQWEGVYFVYPQPMGMKAELRSSGGNAVEGELTFYPLNTNNRNILGTIRGKYALKGTYDPLTQTFELAPGKWIEKPSRLVSATMLRGVLSVQRQEIAGFLVSGQNQNLQAKTHFVMSRPQQSEDRLTEPMINAVTTGGRGLGRLLGGAPSGDDLVKWASRFKVEYPDMDINHTVLGTLLGHARNLFEDEYFHKFFGKTFDQMSPSDRAAVVNGFHKANVQGGSRLGSIFRGESSDELKQYAFLAGAFSSSGTDSAAEITLSVLTHRVIRSWRDAMQDRMRHWPGEADVFERLARIEVTGKVRLITLWPSEQKGFEASLADARRRLSAQVLEVAADRAIAAAQGYQGIRDLAGWADQNKEILQYASGGDRVAITGKIDARLQELLEPMIAEEKAKLAFLGEGEAAVTAGNRWHLDFTSRYGLLEDRPVVRSALDQLAKRRGDDLKAAQGYIAARLRSAKTAQGVENTLTQWLPVQGDRRTTAGAALAEIAGERKQRIAVENKFSDKEIALMKRRLGTVDVPARPNPPTSEEIGLAFLREIAALGGEQVSRTTGHYTVPPAGLLGVYNIVELLRVDLLGVAPAGGGSYVCKYSFKAHFSFPPEFLDKFGIRRSPVHMNMLNAQLQQLNSTKPVLIDHFVLTPNGWRSPTLNQRGLNAMFTVQRSWAEGLERAVQALRP
jgi:hypothetical protein